MTEKEINILMKFRSNPLLKAIREKNSNLSITQNAKELDICVASLFHFINFKKSPVTLNKNRSSKHLANSQGYYWTRAAWNVAMALNIPAQYLFPEELWKERKNKFEAEVDVQDLMLFTDTINLLNIKESCDPEILLLITEKENEINKALKYLTPREESIVKDRFGFESNSMTLKEIATKNNVSQERIRQISAKALRKLRHPRVRHIFEDLINAPRKTPSLHR